MSSNRRKEDLLQQLSMQHYAHLQKLCRKADPDGDYKDLGLTEDQWRLCLAGGTGAQKKMVEAIAHYALPNGGRGDGPSSRNSDGFGNADVKQDQESSSNLSAEARDLLHDIEGLHFQTLQALCRSADGNGKYGVLGLTREDWFNCYASGLGAQRKIIDAITRATKAAAARSAAKSAQQTGQANPGSSGGCGGSTRTNPEASGCGGSTRTFPAAPPASGPSRTETGHEYTQRTEPDSGAARTEPDASAKSQSDTSDAAQERTRLLAQIQRAHFSTLQALCRSGDGKKEYEIFNMTAEQWLACYAEGVGAKQKMVDAIVKTATAAAAAAGPSPAAQLLKRIEGMTTSQLHDLCLHGDQTQVFSALGLTMDDWQQQCYAEGDNARDEMIDNITMEARRKMLDTLEQQLDLTSLRTLCNDGDSKCKFDVLCLSPDDWKKAAAANTDGTKESIIKAITAMVDDVPLPSVIQSQQSFRVQRRDGSFAMVVAADLVRNAALHYLRMHPTSTGKECFNLNKSHVAEECTFIHLVEGACYTTVEGSTTATAAAAATATTPTGVSTPASQLHQQIARQNMAHRVLLRDGSIQTLADEDFIPNAALHFLREHPSSTGKECTNINNGHSPESCNFVHVRRYLVKSAAGDVREVSATEFIINRAMENLRSGGFKIGNECKYGASCDKIALCTYCHFKQPLLSGGIGGDRNGGVQYVGIVVDGFSFTRRYGWGIDVFRQLVDDATSGIKASCLPNNSATDPFGGGGGYEPDVRSHRSAKVFLFPNPTDALKKRLISNSQVLATIDHLEALRKDGWHIVHTNFKLIGESWAATAEDVAFANECSKLCRSEALEPMGGSPARVTLNHLVLVTADNDHLSTLLTQSNRERRWLEDVTASFDVNQPLRRAAREMRRLLEFSVKPLAAVAADEKRIAMAATAQQQQLSTEPCVHGAECKDYRCHYAHPSTRPLPCPNVECDDVKCDMLHQTLEVRKVDGTLTTFPMNHLLNTVGKINAEGIRGSTGKPPQLCKHAVAKCLRKEACNFLHVNPEVSGEVLDDEGSVPEGFVLVRGELVAESDLEPSAGKERALLNNHRRGDWCKNAPCLFGVHCTFLHRRTTTASLVTSHHALTGGPRVTCGETRLQDPTRGASLVTDEQQLAMSSSRPWRWTFQLVGDDTILRCQAGRLVVTFEKYSMRDEATMCDLGNEYSLQKIHSHHQCSYSLSCYADDDGVCASLSLKKPPETFGNWHCYDQGRTIVVTNTCDSYGGKYEFREDAFVHNSFRN